MPTMTFTAPWGADLECEIEIVGIIRPDYRIASISHLDDDGDWVLLTGPDDTKARAWLMHSKEDEIMARVFEELAEEEALFRRRSRGVDSMIGRAD